METLRVFVAGATGLLGREVVTELADRGHIAIGLTSNRQDDETVAKAGGVPRRGRFRDSDSLAWAIGDADVVVNVANQAFSGMTVGDDPKRENKILSNPTKNLTIEAADCGVERYVHGSVVWLVRRDSGGEIDEMKPPTPDNCTAMVREGEQWARAARKFNLRPTILRTGWVYAANAPETKAIGRRLLSRRMPAVAGGLVGTREAEMSFLHQVDGGTAFANACQQWDTGTFHVVDREPVSLIRWLRAFAERLDAPEPFRLPGWLIRPVMGTDTVRFLTTGFPTSADLFEETFDWTPSVPTYREGLDRVVEKWYQTGVLKRQNGKTVWMP